MSKLAKLLLIIIALTMLQDAARAYDRACKFVERGYGYIKIEERGEALTYWLEASGPSWATADVGWHAPGWLSCESCDAASKGAGGLYHFAVRPDLSSDRSFKPPATAAERVERRQEKFGYPSMSIGPKGLAHRASREGISLGPLSGYAVLYRITRKEPGKKATDIGAAGEPGLLVIHLTDGCIAFETSILNVPREDGNTWALLDSLLSEVAIKKIRTADVTPPIGGMAVVR